MPAPFGVPLLRLAAVPSPIPSQAPPPPRAPAFLSGPSSASPTTPSSSVRRQRSCQPAELWLIQTERQVRGSRLGGGWERQILLSNLTAFPSAQVNTNKRRETEFSTFSFLFEDLLTTCVMFFFIKTVNFTHQCMSREYPLKKNGTKDRLR